MNSNVTVKRVYHVIYICIYIYIYIYKENEIAQWDTNIGAFFGTSVDEQYICTKENKANSLWMMLLFTT